MKALKEYLSSSTIHGLYYIGSTNSRILKIFWIVIVFTGFSIAFNMILGSVSSWKKSPVISTIETKPISDARFPQVTVCPPEGTNTIFNYDLTKVGNETFDSLGNVDYGDLYNSVEPFVLKEYYERFLHKENALVNLKYIQDMYYGMAKYYGYMFETNAKDGKISTPEFRSKFDSAKFEKHLRYRLHINANDGQAIEISLDLDLHIKHEVVFIIDRYLDEYYSIRKSGKHKLKFTKKKVDVRFKRKFNERDFTLWQNKRMTGMSINWTVTGKPKKKKDEKPLELVVPNLRTAMNLFLHWTENNSTALVPVEDNLNALRKAQSQILGSENYNATLNITTQVQIFQSILDSISEDTNLEDDTFQAKRNLSRISDELILKAYNFYLQSLYSPPRSVENLKHFYGELSFTIVQSAIRVLLNNLRKKSVFNTEQHLLKLIDKQFPLKFEHILQLSLIHI